jgi:hypothetical protein
MIIKTDKNIKFIELYLLKMLGWKRYGNHMEYCKWVITNCASKKPNLYSGFSIIIGGKPLSYVRKFCYDNKIGK